MAITQVAPDVFRAGSRYVNWYLLDAGSHGITLVDAGLPGYLAQLDPALRAIGKSRSDVRAVMLTHGHIDHIGFADVMASEGAAIYLHPADTNLAGRWKHRETQRPITRYMHTPGTWMFLAHCIRHGATKTRAMPAAVPLQDGQTADVPGAPQVTHVPGHTDGSVALDFRDHGVLFVGDLLCTVSMASGRSTNPRLQSRGSNKNSDQALTSLDRLQDVASRIVLPGHGPPWQHGIAAAADSARSLGCY